jgi:hypothetical protein
MKVGEIAGSRKGREGMEGSEDGKGTRIAVDDTFLGSCSEKLCGLVYREALLGVV